MKGEQAVTAKGETKGKGTIAREHSEKEERSSHGIKPRQQKHKATS